MAIKKKSMKKSKPMPKPKPAPNGGKKYAGKKIETRTQMLASMGG
jgi:hypothetical protein